jgi:prolyl oligopeptidase
VRFGLTSWTQPPAHFAFDPERGVQDLGLAEPWPVDYGHLLTEMVDVESADGTRIPLTIIRRADAALDGSAPARLGGYAAYGMVFAPFFLPMHLTSVDRGSVVAFCHARGGGERGKEWHLAGTKQNKERGVDDFIACAEYLVREGYTSPSRLTAGGTSAGGLLVGCVITRRPELFAAAVLRVPVGNLLRFLEVGEGGPANQAEFGSPDDDADFTAILASDPYHRVRDGVSYPAVVLTAGLYDVRAPIWEPAKLAARLQAASTGGPVLLRVEWGAGHGFGSKRSQFYEEAADLFSFDGWCSGIAMGE